MDFLRSPPPPHMIAPHIAGAGSVEAGLHSPVQQAALSPRFNDDSSTDQPQPQQRSSMSSFNSLNIVGSGAAALGGAGGRNSVVVSPAPTIRRDSTSSVGSSSHSRDASSHSPYPASSSSSMTSLVSSGRDQQLVLRGSELTAFTGALREMVRTNAVRASRQQQLNETNAQMHAMSFFLHYCNGQTCEHNSQQT